ncbi:T9SS type B sorting domain-containing protein [uncultured Flavobacterium sp.]|mgnify:CR=1 FL=1|uniref:T9SS type B sorting domain-containing protein n=1 Tax=uncultured Flavobacterium sp. TaxID=165435 RepID=UPI0030EB4B04
MKNKYYIFIFLVLSFTIFGQNLPNDCQNYIQACDNQSVSYNVSGAGVQEIIPQSCQSQENNSLWLRVTIEQAGTLGFTLIPNSNDINEDYDFWVFGPNSDCGNLGSSIRCSTTNPLAANQHNNYTGMNASSTDISEGPGADGNSFVKQLDVLAGESYFIVIDRPVGSSPFTLNWSGTATIANPFSTQSFDDFNDVILCDDGADNLEPYDFLGLSTSFLGSIIGYSVSYFASNQDASLNLNEITGLINVSQGTYFARIDHISSSCFIIKPIEVVFNSLLPLQVLGCDDTPDGVFSFDTTNVESDLLNGLTGFDLTYSDQNNNSLSSPLPNPFITSSQTINVTLTSNTSNPCAFTTTIDFIINNKPQFFSVPSSLTTLCNQNDPSQISEFAAFDTSSFQNTILGSQTGLLVEYYDENNVQLSSPLPNPFTTSTQNITVKVINSNDLSCFITGVISLQVLSLPNIEINGQEMFVCNNLPNYYVNLNAGLNNVNQISNFTYQWYINNNIISGETGYALQVNEVGSYSVTVTNSNNCENTRTIVVNESDIAVINNVIVNDFSDDNTLLIDATGIGVYLYSLDNITYQTSNVFSHLIPGIYDIYVKDERGCGVVNKEINVLGAPKFFSPNGDGYNDFWNIKGVDARLNAKTVIRIFDRYGKLLTQINPLSYGWDGTYNKKTLPADDYWYTIELNNGRIVKGHFSLLR